MLWIGVWSLKFSNRRMVFEVWDWFRGSGLGFRVSGSEIGVWGLGFRDRAITANTSTQSSRSALWVRERHNLRGWGVGRWVFARALGCLMVDGFWLLFWCVLLVGCCLLCAAKQNARTNPRPKGDSRKAHRVDRRCWGSRTKHRCSCGREVFV